MAVDYLATRSGVRLLVKAGVYLLIRQAAGSHCIQELNGFVPGAIASDAHCAQSIAASGYQATASTGDTNCG